MDMSWPDMLDWNIKNDQNKKIIMDSYLKQPNSKETFPYFVREIAALTMLKKAGVPHVVELKSVKSDGSLELKRYDGDLYDVEDTALETENQVIYTIYRVLVTMSHIQHLNLSHRDIKPENILASKDGNQIAVCDFGLARYYSNGHYPDQTTPSVQTAYYRAPEIMFQDFKDEERYEIGKVNPNNMDIWSLGITALKLLDLDDFLPPHIDEDELTMDELYDLYEQMYGPEGLFAFHINDAEDSSEVVYTRFLWLVCDMLTMNSDLRPDAKTLLCRPIFDCYRSYDSTVDLSQFEQARASDLLKVLPETENDKRIRQHLSSIAHYPFNNVESARLAICILYLLPKEERVSVDIMTVIGLAAAIFDTDIIDMSVSETITLLDKLNYDVMLPVMHEDVVQRLARLFSTV